MDLQVVVEVFYVDKEILYYLSTTFFGYCVGKTRL